MSGSNCYCSTVEAPQILEIERIEKTEQTFVAVTARAAQAPAAGVEAEQALVVVAASAGLAPTMVVVQASKFPLPSSDSGDFPGFRPFMQGLRRCWGAPQVDTAQRHLGTGPDCNPLEKRRGPSIYCGV